jgi:hypothetical protein
MHPPRRQMAGSGRLPVEGVAFLSAHISQHEERIIRGETLPRVADSALSAWFLPAVCNLGFSVSRIWGEDTPFSSWEKLSRHLKPDLRCARFGRYLNLSTRNKSERSRWYP